MTTDDANLFSHFRRRFLQHPDTPALSTERGESWRFRDLDQRSAAMARCLHDLGLNPGDRVSVQIAKSPQALCLYLACLRGGFVYHPLNPAYTAAELQYFLGDAEPSAVICDPADIDALKPIAAAAGCHRLFTLDAGGSGSFATLADGSGGGFDPLPRRADDMAALLYSSGTTGVPKGIRLTHGNLLSNAEALVSAWGFTGNDRLLHALPIFHVHGLFVAISCALLSGAGMRWLTTYSAPAALKLLPECTVMMGVPTYYTRLLAEPGLSAGVTAGMRLFVSGSAPLLTETFLAFEARTGHRILERYGLSETGMNTSNPLYGLRKPGTVGPPLPGVDLRICDDAGNTLGVGEIGNVQVRGPNVFAGYWKLPEKTAEDFTADGYFDTGDKGQIDADGYLSIVGRARDMVISGGLNVYPREVERVIDAVDGVRESAVIGIPHPDFGEAVVALIVADSPEAFDEAAISAACEAQLANFKRPKRILRVDKLPRNAMAKVQKNALRADYAALFAE